MSPATKTRILVTVLCLLAVSTAGCQVFAWAVVVFFPKPKVPAMYEFDNDLRVLVFPDNPHCPLEYPYIRDQLAEKLNHRLTQQDLVADTVPFESLRIHQEQMDRRYRLTEGQPAPLDALASKVGADAVLYIDIRQFSLRNTPEAPLWTGKLGVMVQVVDAQNQRLWPAMDQAEGYPVSVQIAPTANDSTTYGLTLTEKLAERMAEQISQLFYEHRPAS